MKSPRTIHLEPMTKGRPDTTLADLAILAPVAAFCLLAIVAALYCIADRWAAVAAAMAPV